MLATLTEQRRTWFAALLVPARHSPARHSIAALRTRSAVARRVWTPASVATA
jgi:hypothetical protein